VNKAELIDALIERLGDRRTATAALDAVLTEIQNAVTKGDKVSITGFGVFEKRVRAARTARNPRTGEAVRVKRTSVPAFRPGTGFKELVAAGRVVKAAPAKKATKAVKTTIKKAAPARKSTRAATSPARRRSTAVASSPSSRRRTSTTMAARRGSRAGW
jgi:DNA-binding protein HU-beta